MNKNQHKNGKKTDELGPLDYYNLPDYWVLVEGYKIYNQIRDEKGRKKINLILIGSQCVRLRQTLSFVNSSQLNFWSNTAANHHKDDTWYDLANYTDLQNKQPIRVTEAFNCFEIIIQGLQARYN